jgi:hypothetical protein
MWLIPRSCKKLRLRKRLQDYVRFLQRRSECHPSELLLALLYAVIMGLRRMNKAEILQYNGALLEMFEMDGPALGVMQAQDLRLEVLRDHARLFDSRTASSPPGARRRREEKVGSGQRSAGPTAEVGARHPGARG